MFHMRALALAMVIGGLVSAAALAVLIASGRRPRMAIMSVVWPLTGLYWGPVAIWGFLRYGRAATKPAWAVVAVGVSHCGAGCSLGDLVGEVIVFLGAWTWRGAVYPVAALTTFVLGWSFGVVFQYFAIVPMRHLSPGKGIWAAIKADTLSILAFQAGMLAWMALVQYRFSSPPLRADQWRYWSAMQIAMIVGFFAAYPVNAWLMAKGWKEKM